MNRLANVLGLIRSAIANRSRGFTIVAAVLLVFLLGWVAQCAKAETRLSATADIVHAPGTSAIFVEHRPAQIPVATIGGYYQGSRGDSALIAVELLSPKVLGCRAGIGPAYVPNTNEVNGTRWNFSLSLYCYRLRSAELVVRHISHGADFGIARERANLGWNFVGLSFSL